MVQRLVCGCGMFLVALALSACDSSEGGSGGGSGGSGASSGTGSQSSGTGGESSGTGGQSSGTGGSSGSVTWGESDPGASVGPFGELKAFRSGCGEQLWARWIPREDFALQAVTMEHSDGAANQVTFFEQPSFEKDQKTVFLLSDSGPFEEGTYTLDFKVNNPDGSTLTHTLVAPADELFRWPAQIEFESAHNDTFNGLQVTIDPAISGTVVRMFLYDGETACLVFSKTLFDAATIKAGTKTEIDVGATGLTSGKTYTLVLQGVDSARSYVYYATLDLDAP